MQIIKKYFWILVIGLILRMLIAAFTYHPDVRILNFTSAIFLREGNINPYTFYDSLQSGDNRKQIYGLEITDDLPLQYWIHLPFDLILRPFINPNVEEIFLPSTNLLFGNPFLNIHLLLIKFPLLLLDLLAAIILSQLVPKALEKKALLWWIFNPVTLWATAAVGQVDIIPVFFMMLCAFLLQRDKKPLAALSLGMGAAIKSFPFLLAPFLIFLEKTWWGRLKLGVLIAIPWIFSVIPYIGFSNFRHNALFASQLDKIFYSRIGLSGGESIFLTVTILSILYLWYLQKKRDTRSFLNFSLVAILTILSFSHFHIQWFLWAAPFLILTFINYLNESVRVAIILLFVAVLGMLFLFESSLQVKLFAPLIPSLDNALGLAELLKKDQADFLRDISASIFLSAGLFISFFIMRKEQE